MPRRPSNPKATSNLNPSTISTEILQSENSTIRRASAVKDPQVRINNCASRLSQVCYCSSSLVLYVITRIYL